MATNSSLSFAGYHLFGMNSPLDTTATTPLLAPTSRLSYYIAAAGILLVAFVMRVGKRSESVHAPFYNASMMKWMFDAETLVRDSYGKFYDNVYQIRATEGVQTLIPPKLLSELRGLPEDTLSAVEAVSEAMMTTYTDFTPGPHGELFFALIRTKLSQNLARLVPRLKKELEHIVATEYPTSDEWTPIKIQPLALRTIARLSGSTFVGSALNRNEAWIDTSINFAVHVFLAVVKLQFFPAWLRPIAQYLVSDLRQIRRDIENATSMLQPVIEERLQQMERDEYDQEKPDDFTQWLLESLPDEQRRDYVAQTKLQLILSAASIHTTTNLVVDCLYDLAAYPEIQEELRKEATKILKSEGGWEAKESMGKLKRLDSFMKEVQRLSGNVTVFIRKVIKPIDLSDGTHLPAGTKLLAPLAGLCRDEKYYPNPDTFDPWRFLKLRQASPEDANRYQFTSIDDVNLHFGAGKHACPGRFFAGNTAKMVLAYLLLRYDIKLKDGEQRPRSMMIMMSKTPNPKGEILLRRRNVEA